LIKVAFSSIECIAKKSHISHFLLEEELRIIIELDLRIGLLHNESVDFALAFAVSLDHLHFKGLIDVVGIAYDHSGFVLVEHLFYIELKIQLE
jgi:hypothetical protein